MLLLSKGVLVMIRIIVAISLLFISTPSFATEQIKRTQFLLNQLGYNVGSIDGVREIFQ